MRKKINFIILLVSICIFSIHYYNKYTMKNTELSALNEYRNYVVEQQYSKYQNKYRNQKKYISLNKEIDKDEVNSKNKLSNKNLLYERFKLNNDNKTDKNESDDKKNINKKYKRVSGHNYGDFFGELIIPSIKKEIVVYNGINYKNMLSGACTLRNYSYADKGNIVICGHYMDDKNLLFGGVVDLKVGDRIIFKNNGKSYNFKVFKTMVSNDERWDLVGNDAIKVFGKKDPIITLMTCYYNEQGKRFFVFGEFIEVR